MTQENRRQSEMEFYKGISYNLKGEEFPEHCIHCHTKTVTILKKLPRTFKCKNNHMFSIAELREYWKKPVKRFPV